MKKTIKKSFLSIYTLVLILVISLFPVQNIDAAGEATVSFSLSQSSVTEGTGSIDATIRMTAVAPYDGVASHTLWITSDSGFRYDLEPGGLAGISNPRTESVELNISGLSAGTHTFTLNGQISVMTGNDENSEAVSVSVSERATLTITAPTTTTTTTQAPTTSTTTASPTPTPTTQRQTTRQTTSTQGSTNTPTSSSTASTSTTTAEATQDVDPDLGYTPLTNTRMVTTVDLDIREEPNLSSRYLGDIPEGTVVEVKGVTDNGWYVFELNGQDVYLAGSYLDEVESNEGETTTTVDTTTTTEEDTSETTEEDSDGTETTTVSGDDLVLAREPFDDGYRVVTYEEIEVYSSPVVDSDTIGEISSDMIIEPISLTINTGDESEWYEIDYNGTIAYVRAEDVRNYDEETDAELEVFGAETSASDDNVDDTPEDTDPSTTPSEATTTTSNQNSNNSPSNITLIIGILAAALVILIIVYIILRRNLATEDDIVENELDDLDS